METRSDGDLGPLIRRTNELLVVLAKSAISQTLKEELEDPKCRKLYELTGLEIPVSELGRRIGMGAGSISRTWQRWEQLGLLVKEGKRYRRTLG